LVIDNTAVTDFTGLSLTKIKGNLRIQNNTQLTELTGLGNLSEIGGDITILDNKVPVNYPESEPAKSGLCIIRDLIDSGAVSSSANIELNDEEGAPVNVNNLQSCSRGLNNLLIQEGTFIVYPNPVKSNLTILSDKSIKNIKIYTMIGSLVFTLDDVKNSIDLSSLPAGNYILSCTFDNGITERYTIIKL